MENAVIVNEISCELAGYCTSRGQSAARQRRCATVIAARITVLHCVQHAYNAFQRLVIFGRPWFYRRRGSGGFRRHYR